MHMLETCGYSSHDRWMHEMGGYSRQVVALGKWLLYTACSRQVIILDRWLL